ncbi:MAG: LytTR family DNA-binding domain-containing protein [Bacteroidales bacterium]|nr:LytTR family DNA-binding domain-containing protein [Bacteroidales bacterium]
MNVIILEDETRAANYLERLILKVAPEMKVLAKLETIRDAVPFLKTHPDVDLIFSDVQLADGLSFEIFGQVQVKCPIIFTTAYDHYAIEAFKTNGLDYLLKPVEEERLKQAIEKVKQFSPSIALEKLLSIANAGATKTYKSRFMVKVGDKIKSIPIEEILVFYSLEKATYLHTTSHRDYCIDYSVDQLESLLDPGNCFRISRKYIVSIHACSNILAWTNSRLRLKIEGIGDDDIIVARERVQEFKEWLDR